MVLPSAGSSSAATEEPFLPAAEAIVIGEVYRLTEEIGEAIWPGLDGIPFPIVLVEVEREHLIGWQGTAPEGFGRPFVDSRLEREVMTRARVFAPDLAAAFPAFGPPAVVVIGTMEATGKSPGRWALTLLHEHFHQLQYAAPGYYQSVEELELSNGDQTGMWMLEYPFPYGDEAIGALFDRLAEKILYSLEDDTTPAAKTWATLDELLSALAPADQRYLSFQLWQEGVARHLELRAAIAAARDFTPSEDFLALDGFSGWEAEADAVRNRVLRELESMSLSQSQRVSFYPLGAALGMLLDRDDPDWRFRYLERRFTLSPPATGGGRLPAHRWRRQGPDRRAVSRHRRVPAGT